MKFIEILGLTLLVLLSTLWGVLYSVHNTDPHHWGFIMATAIDFWQGKSLFTETYVQYGIGQPLLFGALHRIMPVNYTSIGIITSVIYAFHLVLIYCGVKKISTPVIAAGLTLAAGLFHTFAVYPWPDYYAGFFISIACYLLLVKKEEQFLLRYVLAGVMLFIAFVFRSTYAISILAAFVTYFAISSFRKSLYDRNLFIPFFTFTGLLVAFIAAVYAKGLLGLWYGQGIGASSGVYHMNAVHIFNLLRRVFMYPDRLVMVSFSCIFMVAFYSIALFTFVKEEANRWTSPFHRGLPLFLAIFGLSGLIQVALGYEVFRLQNSCAPLYLFLGFFILTKFPDYLALLSKRRVRLVVGVYFFFLAAIVPNGSVIFPVYDDRLDTYSESKIKYYQWHRFRPEEQKYYDGLHQYLCDGKRKILNLTMDSSIPYLCEGQQNALKLSFFYKEMQMNIDLDRYHQVQAGDFAEDEVIVSLGPVPVNPKVKLILIGKVSKPGSIRFLGITTDASIYHVERI